MMKQHETDTGAMDLSKEFLRLTSPNSSGVRPVKFNSNADTKSPETPQWGPSMPLTLWKTPPPAGENSLDPGIAVFD
jgi:hypothetical protein